MQMRTGRTTSAAHFRDLLPAHHDLAQPDQALGSMSITADEIIAVVNIDHITIFGMKIGIHYHAARRSHETAIVILEPAPAGDGAES